MSRFAAALLGAVVLLGAPQPVGAQQPVATLSPGEVIEAVTPEGDQVRLLPNGRWEYVDAKKAAVARAVAQRYPENQGCPPGSQGGLFGLGRCIQPGDKDYNRGSFRNGSK